MKLLPCDEKVTCWSLGINLLHIQGKTAYSRFAMSLTLSRTPTMHQVVSRITQSSKARKTLVIVIPIFSISRSKIGYSTIYSNLMGRNINIKVNHADTPKELKYPWYNDHKTDALCYGRLKKRQNKKKSYT